NESFRVSLRRFTATTISQYGQMLDGLHGIQASQDIQVVRESEIAIQWRVVRHRSDVSATVVEPFSQVDHVLVNRIDELVFSQLTVTGPVPPNHMTLLLKIADNQHVDVAVADRILIFVHGLVSRYVDGFDIEELSHG